MNDIQSGALQPLFLRLQACPSFNNRFRGELPRQTWESFKQAWEPGDELTPAVIAGLVLLDPTFAQLLPEAERSQLFALAAKALARYHDETNPPNQPGKIIAATIKENT